MSTKTEHTKYHFRPTSPVAGEIWLVNTTEKMADCIAENAPNNAAAFIVRACNSFEKLVEALEEAMSALCAPLIDEPNHRHNTTRKVAYEAAKAALAAAKEEL
jgi:DNA polymerase III alpha subunit (gram-positive type)